MNEYYLYQPTELLTLFEVYLIKSSTEREDIEQGLVSKRINQPVYFSLLEQRDYDKY